MSSPDLTYWPLPNPTSIRILVLAPGKPGDSDLSFSFLISDLDFDHKAFPGSTPTLVENTFVNGENGSGFPKNIDMGADSTPQQPRCHPFQPYEALSYVWGDLHDQIWVGGDNAIPITKNLYSLLRSLRLPHKGRSLWVDALCINQSDHEEKKVQLALMKRVYQQAEKVIAYLPLSVQDQKSLNLLVPQILRAATLYREHQASKQSAGSDQARDGGPLNSTSHLETKTIIRNANEPMSATMLRAFGGSQPFLESFGLPREDSPLWDSWRHVFALPYFRRMWIWQELLLGNNLHFWFGNAEAAAEPLMIAHHFLDEYSATMNMSYNAAWCASEEDNQDALQSRLVGSANATKMFRDRILRRYGGDGVSQPRLIEKLASVGTFEAADPRDKIYALLGLTSDGASFTQHVSYAPWDSKEQILIRFAKLFIERNEGVEVLLQAGFRDHEPEWASWVPHWDNLERPVALDAARGRGRTFTLIQVDEKSTALNISGIILDEISVVNSSVLETLEVTENGVDMQRFNKVFVRGLSMVFNSLTPRDPEEVFEQLFHVLAQPKTKQERPGKQDEGSETSTAPSQQETLSSDDKANEAVGRETEALRIGFREYLRYVQTLPSQIKAVSNSKEDVTQLMNTKSPAEFHKFHKEAVKNLHHRRLCITKGELIIMSPKRAEVEDKVVLFEGCDIPFVLRPVRDTSGEMIGVEEAKDGKITCRLIGPAFLHFPARKGSPSGESRLNIRLV
ncbi:HET-domain-containing protein [Xylaria bambusicola]|uniref:HET-domain-containing protein n=1 Tax=Xylaria bambusicola TaxID=326684 RepID=UPI002008942F|nr:HET-domain-containing protein [Xylaria bambusicola]KAI0528298.1 HET-domain-containing protein [Xylaria bambusicola]